MCVANLWCAAFFGSLLPPVVFSVAKKMGCSDSVAFLCGFMWCLETMHMVESRSILMDSQLMFYYALALWTALKYWDALTRVRVRGWAMD